MATDIQKVFSDYLAAWNFHDWYKISPFFTDDIFYEDVAVGKVCHGKQELKAYFDDMLIWSADFRFEGKSFFIAGNFAASEWTMSGTHSGDVSGMKATGKKYSILGASISELREGKISRQTDYWNMVTFLQQVGLLPTTTPNWFGRFMMQMMMKRA